MMDLEKQVLRWHSTAERIKSDSGTHFENNLINNGAKEHGIEWVYDIHYHAPASGKTEKYKRLLKTTLKQREVELLKTGINTWHKQPG